MSRNNQGNENITQAEETGNWNALGSRDRDRGKMQQKGETITWVQENGESKLKKN